jgi:hypothetical protein
VEIITNLYFMPVLQFRMSEATPHPHIISQHAKELIRVTSHLHVMTRLRMSKTIHPPPPYAFTARIGTTFITMLRMCSTKSISKQNFIYRIFSDCSPN